MTTVENDTARAVPLVSPHAVSATRIQVSLNRDTFRERLEESLDLQSPVMPTNIRGKDQTRTSRFRIASKLRLNLSAALESLAEAGQERLLLAPRDIISAIASENSAAYA
jgi:hypothetical protein